MHRTMQPPRAASAVQRISMHALFIAPRLAARMGASTIPLPHVAVATTLACEPCGAACSAHQRARCACLLQSAQHGQSDVSGAAAVPVMHCPRRKPAAADAQQVQRATAAKRSAMAGANQAEGEALRRRRRGRRTACRKPCRSGGSKLQSAAQLQRRVAVPPRASSCAAPDAPAQPRPRSAQRQRAAARA